MQVLTSTNQRDKMVTGVQLTPLSTTTTQKLFKFLQTLVLTSTDALQTIGLPSFRLKIRIIRRKMLRPNL